MTPGYSAENIEKNARNIEKNVKNKNTELSGIRNLARDLHNRMINSVPDIARNASAYKMPIQHVKHTLVIPEL